MTFREKVDFHIINTFSYSRLTVNAYSSMTSTLELSLAEIRDENKLGLSSNLVCIQNYRPFVLFGFEGQK